MPDIAFEESVAEVKAKILEKCKLLDECVEFIVAVENGGSICVQFILKGNDYVWEEMVVGPIASGKWVLLSPPDKCPLPKNQIMAPDMVIAVVEHMISLTKPWSAKSSGTPVHLNFLKPI